MGLLSKYTKKITRPFKTIFDFASDIVGGVKDIISPNLPSLPEPPAFDATADELEQRRLRAAQILGNPQQTIFGGDLGRGGATLGKRKTLFGR